MKDKNGCEKALTGITVTQPAKLAATTTVTGVLCNGGSTRKITVNASGGTSPYEYKLGSGNYQTGNSFNVAAGTS